MFGISFAEFTIIFLLILIVMGPEKIPEAARWAGKGLRELRKASNVLRNTLAMEDFDLDLDAPPKKRRISSEEKKDSPSIADTQTRTSDTKTTPQSSESASSGTDTTITEPGPSKPASLPSSGLDQVDDEAFEQMLQERYAAAQANQVRRVPLSPPGATGDTYDVAIDDARRTADHTTTVGLPALEPAEKAS